jgi:hypothetical protein
MPLRYRHDYAADLHRGLPAGDLKPAQEFPARDEGQVRTAIQPISTGFELAGNLRGVTALVPLVHLPVSLAGPGPSGSAGPSRRCRGCLPASPAFPGSACPQLRYAAATAQRRSPSTSARLHGASWRSRSPSQCPGTARSAASAARSLIMISGVTNFLPRPRVRALGTRSARPVRRHAVSSRRSAPRPWTYRALVDRLVRDPHGLIIGEVDPEPVRDLLRAPRRGPAPVGPAPVAPSDPPHVRARHNCAIWPGDRAGEPVLHVRAEPLVCRQPRNLRAPRTPLCMPLRRRCPVVQPVRARGRVAPQLPRDRRRPSGQAAGRSPGHRRPEHARPRCPHARRTTGTGPTRPRKGSVSRRQRDGTTGCRPPATLRSRHPLPQNSAPG